MDDFSDISENPEFIGRLELLVNQWVKTISQVITMKYDLSKGSVLEEIMFHTSLERSLTHIKEQTEHQEVKITIDLLNQAGKRVLVN